MEKISVITGGAGGMGLATAKIIGKDHHIVICDVNQSRLESAANELNQLGIHCDAMLCDITDRSSVDELVKKVADLGTIASVIHTAGLSPQMADADTIMKVNAIGTINITEAFYEIAGEGFVLVNVASMAAHMFPNLLLPKRAYLQAFSDKDAFFKKAMFICKLMPEGLPRTGTAYSISKNFVVWYSKKNAARFGQKGARIVSVCPGTIDTEMGRLEEKSGSAEMLKDAALKRFGKPEEVAEVLVFCASEKASYLTGADIICDGGVIASKVK